MRITQIIVLLIIASLFAFTACSSPASSPTPTQKAPTQTQTPTTSETESVSSEDWNVLNRWLSELYGLPPVKNTEQLKSAATLVSSFWFEKANIAISKLEQNDIPWARVAPFYSSFNYYVLHDAQLLGASDPIEFMAADKLLADSVKDLQDTADELVRMKSLGESFKIFPTDEDARKWFRELDKDWERLMQEAIDKAK